MRSGGPSSLIVIVLCAAFAPLATAQDLERDTGTTSATAQELERDTTAASTKPATAPAAQAGGAVHTIRIDPQPTRVTLRMENARADVLFAELCAQANVVYRPEHEHLWGGEPPTLDAIDLRDVPFWSAFAEIARRTGARPSQSWTDPRHAPTLIVARGGGAAPASGDGPLLVRATHIERRATINYGGSRFPETVTLSMQVLPEPRLRPYAVAGTLHLEEARDEAGLSLLPVLPPRPRPTSPFAPNLLAQETFPVALAYPAGAGQRVAILRGRVEAYVPQRVFVAEIPNPMGQKDGASLPLAGCTLTAKRVDVRSEPNLEITLRRGEATDDQTWVDLVAAMSGPNVRMTTGGRERVIPPSGGFGYGAELARLQRSLPESSRQVELLRVELPIDYHKISQRFEFKDVPLP